MKTLTQAEEQVMHVLWDMEKALVRDILEQLPDPKPAYNTVSTVVRVLEKKGFVDHKAFGTTYEYYPLISKEAYTKFHFGKFMDNYFNSSFTQLASFFTKENTLTMKELEELMQIVKKEIKDKEK